MRDFIHSSDVCRAVEVLINTNEKNINDNTYNISSGETLTILELAQTVKKVYQNRFKQEIKIILNENKTSVSPDTGRHKQESPGSKKEPEVSQGNQNGAKKGQK